MSEAAPEEAERKRAARDLQQRLQGALFGVLLEEQGSIPVRAVAVALAGVVAMVADFFAATHEPSTGEQFLSYTMVEAISEYAILRKGAAEAVSPRRGPDLGD